MTKSQRCSAGFSLMVALSAGGCADSRDEASMTLTGCVQLAGSRYVITQVNEPGHPVGDRATQVQRDQMIAATHSYALEGDEEKFADLVGQRVRMIGRLTESSSLGGGGMVGQREVGTRGDQTRAGNVSDPTDRYRDRLAAVEPEADDLAQLTVEAITQIAETCGA